MPPGPIDGNPVVGEAGAWQRPALILPILLPMLCLHNDSGIPMKKEKRPSATADAARRERLAAALRENLARRKTQAREREAAENATFGERAGDQDLSRGGRVK